MKNTLRFIILNSFATLMYTPQTIPVELHIWPKKSLSNPTTYTVIDNSTRAQKPHLPSYTVSVTYKILVDEQLQTITRQISTQDPQLTIEQLIAQILSGKIPLDSYWLKNGIKKRISLLHTVDWLSRRRKDSDLTLVQGYQAEKENYYRDAFFPYGRQNSKRKK